MLILYKQSGDLKRHKVTGFHLQVHRAFHRAPIPGTTSRQCGHTPASGEPQEPNTEEKKQRKVQCKSNIIPQKSYWGHTNDEQMSKDVSFTSGVPQKVVVVPLGSRPSLQRPKSVRTMCPCESSRMFSGFRSLSKTRQRNVYSKCIRAQVYRCPLGGAVASLFTCTLCAESGGSQVHLQFQQRRTWLWAPGRFSLSGDGRTAGVEKSKHLSASVSNKVIYSVLILPYCGLPLHRWRSPAQSTACQ